MVHAPQISEVSKAYIHSPLLQQSSEAERKIAEQIRTKLIQKGLYENRSDVFVVFICTGVFAVGEKGTVNTFYNTEGICILNLDSVSKDYGFSTIIGFAGYREIRGIDKIYRLYRLSDIDARNGNPLPGKKEIPNTSPEYYKAWQDMSFYEDRVLLDAFRHINNDGTYSKLDNKKTMDVMLRSGATTILDLEVFLAQKQISQEEFNRLLPDVRDLLLSQINDIRFRKFDSINSVAKATIKIEDIERLLKKGLISPELATKAKKAIEKRDMIKVQREGAYNKTSEALPEKTGVRRLISAVKVAIRTLNINIDSDTNQA